MFILKCKIVIGDYTFSSVHEVEITKSVEDLMDTALIKLPTKFRIRSTGELKFIEEVIKPGDKVEITLAYDGKFEKMEFAGYVSKVSPKIPLEIHCEDAMWLLRRKNITKAFGKTTLREVLTEVVSGTGLQLSPDIPHHPIDKLIVKEQNGTQVLQYFKENHMMTSFIDDAGRLYCGLAQLTNIGQTAKYDLNYNLVSNDLEFKTEDDKKIKVKYTYIAKDNKKTTVEVGDPDGEIRSLNTHIVSNEAQLKEMASAELKKLKYAGFEGSVKSFLIPFATRGMAAEIIDKEHPNRKGKYFIKKVVTSFGTSGARRTVTIGNKL
ncbi:late control protein [Chryseobacterium sp. 6424]|uniref:late control protein n=1 Tax=Chryseobacterium sp. 6424 TaxID=2039166 RepID=UPI000EFCCFFD|nr:late control protein [Chryseobacterium sp. 6424]AYO58185.1 late control protein [Chryseobacterium sp. 6424]